MTTTQKETIDWSYTNIYVPWKAYTDYCYHRNMRHRIRNNRFFKWNREKYFKSSLLPFPIHFRILSIIVRVGSTILFGRNKNLVTRITNREKLIAEMMEIYDRGYPGISLLHYPSMDPTLEVCVIPEEISKGWSYKYVKLKFFELLMELNIRNGWKMWLHWGDLFRFMQQIRKEQLLTIKKSRAK